MPQICAPHRYSARTWLVALPTAITALDLLAAPAVR
jgi:hypothetical protein